MEFNKKLLNMAVLIAGFSFLFTAPISAKVAIGQIRLSPMVPGGRSARLENLQGGIYSILCINQLVPNSSAIVNVYSPLPSGQFDNKLFIQPRATKTITGNIGYAGAPNNYAIYFDLLPNYARQSLPNGQSSGGGSVLCTYSKVSGSSGK